MITDVGMDELSLKKRHKLYVTLLTDLSDPDRPEMLAVAQGRGHGSGPEVPGSSLGGATPAGPDPPGGHGVGLSGGVGACG